MRSVCGTVLSCKFWYPIICLELVFKRGKDVHPSLISSLATFAWRRHCKTLRGTVLSFVERSVLSLCQLFARDITAMPRGLHAGPCHAFLVLIVLAKMKVLLKSHTVTYTVNLVASRKRCKVKSLLP